MTHNAPGNVNKSATSFPSTARRSARFDRGWWLEVYVSSHHVMSRVGANHLACALGVGTATTGRWDFLFPKIRELSALSLAWNAYVICMIRKSDLLGDVLATASRCKKHQGLWIEWTFPEQFIKIPRTQFAFETLYFSRYKTLPAVGFAAVVEGSLPVVVSAQRNSSTAFTVPLLINLTWVWNRLNSWTFICVNLLRQLQQDALEKLYIYSVQRSSSISFNT